MASSKHRIEFGAIWTNATNLIGDVLLTVDDCVENPYGFPDVSSVHPIKMLL